MKLFDPSLPQILNTNEWYINEHPTHTLRKSGSVLALRRCAYNYSAVATMAWENTDLLRKTYAPPKMMLNQKLCEYCNPPQSTQKTERFCEFEHYLAYYYGGKNPMSKMEDIAYLQAQLKKQEKLLLEAGIQN